MAAALAAERVRAASQAAGSGQQHTGETSAAMADSLDAFMSVLATSIEHDKVKSAVCKE